MAQYPDQRPPSPTIPVDDMPTKSSSSHSTSPESSDTNHSKKDNQRPATMMIMKKQHKKKDRKVRVVSFRLSERDYERHLSMAKICHENGLTKGPDIVSYIRLSMECLSRYIITSQAEAERSAEKKGGEQQQQLQIKKEGNVEQHDLDNYHTMTAS